jgi:hypothetical protein
MDSDSDSAESSFEPDSTSSSSSVTDSDDTSSSMDSFDFPRSSKAKPNALLNYIGIKQELIFKVLIV